MTSSKKKSCRVTPEPLTEEQLDLLPYRPSIAQRYTEEEVARAVQSSNGLVTKILTFLDCTYHQWRVYIAEHRKIAELADDCKRELVERAEDTVDSMLTCEDAKLRLEAAKFVLSTLGKSRGWERGDGKCGVAVNVGGEGQD